MVEKKEWNERELKVLADFYERDDDHVLQHRLLCLKYPVFRSLEDIRLKRGELGYLKIRGHDIMQKIVERQERLRGVV